MAYELTDPQAVAQHQQRIARILEAIHLDQEHKHIGTRQWERCISFLILNEGQRWESIRRKMRSYVGISYRYIDEYIDSLKEWGILQLEQGMIIITVEAPPRQRRREHARSNTGNTANNSANAQTAHSPPAHTEEQ